MTGKQIIKLALSLVRRPVYTSRALSAQGNQHAPEIRQCIRNGAEWLLRAQQKSTDGNGYSRRFRLINGWDRGYIETTGYIIPTMLDVAELLEDCKFRDSAFLAAEWLLSLQNSEGAFTDIESYIPQVFDTGQVMLGLNRMYRETGDERFLSSACKAAEWLVNIQENDGTWRQHAYNDRPHSYYSRVAAALIETGLLGGGEKFVAAGKRNLEWVLSQEKPNGYFAYTEFRPGEDALLHTIVYVLEGFSMAYRLTGEERWLEATVKGANALKTLLNDEGLLYSQYNERWEPTNTEFCITGLAQYAGICLDVYKYTHDIDFLHLSEKIIQHLSRWQLSNGEDICGALPSSIPVWGYYGGMEFYNWNVKFFLDAAIKKYLITSDLQLNS